MGLHPTHGETLAEVFEGMTPDQVIEHVKRSYASRIQLYEKWDAHLHHVGHGEVYLCPNGVVQCVACCRYLGGGYTVFHTVVGPCCLTCWESPHVDARPEVETERPGWWRRFLSWLRWT